MKLIPKNVATLVGVVAVIGGIFFIALPTCGCGGTAAHHVEALSAIRSISTGLNVYIDDYDGIYPGAQDQPTFRRVVNPYLQSPSATFDFPQFKVSSTYSLNLANVDDNKLPNWDEVITLSSPFSNSKSEEPSSYIAAFADNHAKILNVKSWNADYADLLDRNYPRVSHTFLPSVGTLTPKP